MLSFYCEGIYALSENPIIVPIGTAKVEKLKVHYLFHFNPEDFSGQEKEYIKEIVNLVHNDFLFYQKKIYMKKKRLLSDDVDYKAEKRNKYDFVIYFSVTSNKVFNKKNPLKFHIKLYDLVSMKERLSETESVNVERGRQFGHYWANEIYKKIYRKESIFLSKITFVSDLSTKDMKNNIKELYMVDFDGHNLQQLTRHGSVVLSPSFSFDGKKILYSMIEGKGKYRKNVLKYYHIETRKSYTLSNRRGLNSGAIFLPDDQSVILTLSFTGNPELYRMDLISKKLYVLTRNPSIDVDPTIARDTKKLAFLSGRSGRAMIHIMDTDGVEKNIKRIGFVGKFNATPRFSPLGQEIVFSTWIDGAFNLYRMDENGQNLVRLTKNFGSNEGPSYANDGQFIVFTSKKFNSLYKKFVQNLYIMNRDGEIIGQLTKKMGNCHSPRWSK